MAAAEFLAAGASITQAAQKVGVRRQTVSDWQRLPAFRALLEGLVRQHREDARDRLGRLVAPAVAALEADLTDPATPPALRQKAAQLVLDRTGHGPRSEVQAQVATQVEVANELDSADWSRLTNEEVSTMGRLLRKLLGKPEPGEAAADAYKDRIDGR